MRGPLEACQGEREPQAGLIGVGQILDTGERLRIERFDEVLRSERCQRIEPWVRQLAKVTVQRLLQHRDERPRIAGLARAREILGVLTQERGIVDRGLWITTPGLRTNRIGCSL